MFQIHKNLLFVTMYFFVCCCSICAELSITNIQPRWGQTNNPLTAIITGNGFDEKTRVSMFFDITNKRSIISSLETPGSARKIVIQNNFTFIADSDAGGFQIVDISNINDPQLKIYIDTPGQANGILISENFVFICDGEAGIQIIDISTLEQPEIIGSYDTDGYAHDFDLQNDFLFVADGYNGLVILNVKTKQTPELINVIELSGDITSVAVFENTILAADYHSGLKIISYENILQPLTVGYLDTPGKINAIEIFDNHALLAADDAGLLVVDISTLNDPKLISQLNTPGRAFDITIKDHLVCIADYSSGVYVADISNFMSPQKMGIIDTPGLAMGISVQEQIAYIADGDFGLQIINISDPSNTSIGKYTVSGQVNDMELINKNLYMVTQDMGLYVLDISDISLPSSVKNYELANSNAVSITNNLAYISMGSNGFQIVDMEKQLNPIIYTNQNITGFIKDIAFYNSFALLASFRNGLQWFDISNPSEPVFIKSIEIAGYANSIFIYQDKAFVAAGTAGIQIVDISNPQKPINIISIPVDQSFVFDIHVENDLAYVACGNGGFQIFDISNANTMIGKRDTFDKDKKVSAIKVKIQEKTAFVVDQKYGVLVVDINKPSNPNVIGTIKTPGTIVDIEIKNNIAFIADESNGLIIEPIPLEVNHVLVKNNSTISVTIPAQNIMEGHYTIRVFNEQESDELSGAVTFSEYVPKAKAILVAGSGDYQGNTIWDAEIGCVRRAYNVLTFQGYEKNNIRFLSPDLDIDLDNDGTSDVNAVASSFELSKTLNQWAYDADNVILYLIGHGKNQLFKINQMTDPVDHLSAQTLDNWLDNFQETMTGELLVIIDACLSGSFVQTLDPPIDRRRIVLTSTSEIEKAIIDNSGMISFSYHVWNGYFDGFNILDSFYHAKTFISKYKQHPILDSNGDGKMDGTDRLVASKLKVGRGIVTASDRPYIESIAQTQQLYGQSKETIWAGPVTDLDNIEKVWAVIISPDCDEGPVNDPSNPYETIDMHDLNNDAIYKATYDRFNTKGTYDIIVYATDTLHNYAIPLSTQYIQTGMSIDLNGNNQIDLSDGILGLTLLSGLTSDILLYNPSKPFHLENVIYILQEISNKK